MRQRKWKRFKGFLFFPFSCERNRNLYKEVIIWQNEKQNWVWAGD